MKKPLLILFLTAGLAASCIYPFEAETDSETSDALVVEGDINVGGITQVSIGRITNLSGNAPDAREYVYNVNVEDENGNIYSAGSRPYYDGMYPSDMYLNSVIDGSKQFFTIDTKDCNPALKHRLHIYTDDNEYASDWLEVHISPAIDSISVNPDEARKQLFIGLSCHSDNEQFFRWKYSETWEYHTYNHADLKYELPVQGTPTWNNGYGIVSRMAPGEETYTCWKSDASSEVMLFSTEHQSDNRFVDLEFLSIPQNSDKLMVMYYINISVQSLSEQAYRYWETLNRTSTQSGDLFAPIPSELQGNITCLTDKDRLCVGYISASTSSSIERFVDNGKILFYRSPLVHYEEDQEIEEKLWKTTYLSGSWKPYTKQFNDMGQEVILWSESRCVDCRLKGGTTTKPSYWPY